MTGTRPLQANYLPQGQHPTPEIASTTASPAEDHSVALRGASRAFVKTPAKQVPLVNTYSGANGALAAATRANNIRTTPTLAAKREIASLAPSRGRGDAGPGNAPLSAAQQSFVRDQAVRGIARPQSSGSLRVSGDETRRTSASPSNIAATLAAARFTPQHTSHSVLQRPRSSNGGRPSPMNTESPSDFMSVAGTASNGTRDALHLCLSLQDQPTAFRRQPIGSPTDASSIAPTKALIDLFEQDSSNVEPKKRSTKTFIKSMSAVPVIQSPKPLRPSSTSAPLTAAIFATSTAMSLNQGAPESRPISRGESSYVSFDRTRSMQQNIPSSTSPHARHASPRTSDGRELNPVHKEEPSKATEEITGASLKLKGIPPDLPAPRKWRKPATTPVSLRKGSAAFKTDSDTSSASSYVSAPEMTMKPKTPPPRRNPLQRGIGRPASVTTSPPSGQSPSNTGLSKNAPRLLVRKQAVPSQSHPNPVTHSWMNDLPASDSEERWIHQPTQRRTPRLDESSLADAIVASSLASSRAPSPSKSQGAPPLPKRHHNILHHRHKGSRTPSPVRGMRQTMRKIPKPEGENLDDPASQRRGRKNLIKKAPNKHHEGDRKRWRDEITERERKRYEGVWAANRGLHILLTAKERQVSGKSGEGFGEDDISNLVVRDIWRRSRLEETVLEEIWDLVDRRAIRRLTREEFVVGMWLIDQRLKGRKLPVKVSASVWASVRRLGDVKVPRHKF